MTENKRFTLKNWNDYAEGDCIYYDNGEEMGSLDVLDTLNNLSYENKQLKLDNNRLVNETAKIIGEHQRKVFELIDEQINEYIYKEKLYKHKGKDREASVYNLYCFCLSNLKKELSE